MKRLTTGCLSLMLVLCLSFAVAVQAEAPADAKSIADWEGLWNSLDTYLDDEGLAEAYATLAERDGGTAEEVQESFQTRYQSDIISLKIEGDTVTFYSAVQGAEASDADKIAEATYTYVAEMPTEMGFSFHQFAADGESEYPVLLLIEVGEDVPGETMRHFHFRYGSDVDELFAIEGWYPTMVKSDSAIELISNDFTIEEE